MFKKYSKFAFKKFENFQRNQWFYKKSKFEFKSMYFMPFLLTPNYLMAAPEKDDNDDDNKNTKEKKGSEEKDNDVKKQNNELEMKQIIRGEYENKVRAYSSIEKKFAIFAEVKNFNDVKMNYFQFFDSLIPFPYSETLCHKTVR